MDILEMAKELGKKIATSDEFVNFLEAEKNQANDEEAQKLIGEYNLKRMNIIAKAEGADLKEEDYAKIRNELAEEFSKLMENELIKKYIDAKEAFDTMYQKVLNIIDFYANGEKQEGGCSGSCSTCGGCH